MADKKTKRTITPADYRLESLGADLPPDIPAPASAREKKPGGRRHELYANLVAIKQPEPTGEWYRVATYQDPRAAARVLKLILDGKQETPKGPFDIEPRREQRADGGVGSYLAAMFVGE